MAQNNWREDALAIMATADPEVAENLLVGAIDLHVHSGPSTMARQLDHLEQVEQAAAVGMKGVLFKDHNYSVGPMLPMLERIAGHHGVAMYGSVVLNNSVGALNPYAVDFNVKSGAKLVYMPTAHAANHIRNTHRNKRLVSNVQLRKPVGITVVDASGELLDSAKEILDIIAEHDVILSSGHLHIAEVWPLFEAAKKRGVTKLLVNHPTYGLHCTYDDIKELVSIGAIIEQSACLFVDSRFNFYPPEELKRQIDAAGPQNTSLGSDLGQVDNPLPVEGFRQMIKLCLGLGFTADEIRLMVRDNPAKLVNQSID
ncbi:MAG: DUF6282 family protein [Paracoccaceae bacterium]